MKTAAEKQNARERISKAVGYLAYRYGKSDGWSATRAKTFKAALHSLGVMLIPSDYFWGARIAEKARGIPERK